MQPKGSAVKSICSKTRLELPQPLSDMQVAPGSVEAKHDNMRGQSCSEVHLSPDVW
jgi:hypothetical protein